MATECLDFVTNAANVVRENFNAGQPVVIEDHMIGIGQMYPQGDVGFQRLEQLPSDAIEIIGINRKLQVTEGTTQGARHCWDSFDGLREYTSPTMAKNPLFGHLYVLEKERTLTHPEHANQTYPAGFIGVMRFQRTAEEELRRIAD